ncbi:MAG: ATP-binding protein [Chitinivibrionales bacterium]
MRHLQWQHFVGHTRLKQTLAAAFDNNALGHAYLFSGDIGVGTFQAALELAMALLCDSDDAVPCYGCESCRQMTHHAHPDFHLVMPVALQKEHKSSDGKLSDEGWKFISEQSRLRINNPYATPEQTGIPTIPVEWIRETNHAILRGSVKGKRNVAVFVDVDLMKKESANAILKTLEEPPAQTVIFLITQRMHGVLPTILSRCQIMRFGYLSPDDIRLVVEKKFSDLSAESVDNAVRCAGGSLAAAFGLIEQPLDLRLEEARRLWQICTGTDALSFAAQLDEFVKDSLEGGKDYQSCERILTYMIYLIRDIFLSNIPGTQKYIRTGFSQPDTNLSRPDVAQRLVSVCQDAISSVRVRGNLPLTLTTCALAIMEIMHGKEQ